MVVSLELDEASRAAVDAARAGSDNQVLVAPRLEDRYASYGVIATLDPVGRVSGGSPAAVLRAGGPRRLGGSPGGPPAAVLRAGGRGRIGSGVTGPGAPLWVEVEPVEEYPDGQVS